MKRTAVDRGATHAAPFVGGGGGDKESRPAMSLDRRLVGCAAAGVAEPAAVISYAGGGSASKADHEGNLCHLSQSSSSSTAPRCRRRSPSCSTPGPRSTPAP